MTDKRKEFDEYVDEWFLAVIVVIILVGLAIKAIKWLKL